MTSASQIALQPWGCPSCDTTNNTKYPHTYAEMAELNDKALPVSSSGLCKRCGKEEASLDIRAEPVCR